MGAVFLYKNEDSVDLNKVYSVFKAKGFAEPKKFNVGEFKILLYRKILIDYDNFIISDQKALFTVGTLVYKGLNYSKSLDRLLIDLINNELDEGKLIGNFLIIYKNGAEFSLMTDKSGIQNLFIRDDKNVLSSSFLACAYSSKGALTVNKNAAVEILTTGNLIGPDTLFNQIIRFELNETCVIPGLNFRNYKSNRTYEFCSDSYSECMDEQIGILEDYFSSLKSLADDTGVDSGITGGHDSRLIMVMALKYFKNISFNTHWRNKKNIEFDSAVEVCKKAETNLNLVTVKDPADMTREEMENNFERSFLFYDGLMRMHSFWTEEYNTRQYREEVLKGKKLGLSGIGGEQYRNEERMNRSNWEINDMVKYKIVLNNCGECFSEGKDLNLLVDSISNKIKVKLGINRKHKMSRLEVKRYLNEVFIPARLGARNNAENQISFFLSPFADYNVSNKAYKICNKLGTSYEFEENMIKKINPKIAAVASDHGFDFYNGEPFLHKVKAFMSDYIPNRLLYRYLLKKHNSKDSSLYKSIFDKSALLKNAVDEINRLSLPIDINKLLSKPDMMPLVFALGYTLKRMEKKISYI